MFMFGKSEQEILKLIQDDLINKVTKQEAKMTREEAVKKLRTTEYGKDATNYWIDNWLEVFEALGLIKFDDPIPRVVLNETTPTSGKLKLYQHENGSYELWYHGCKVWKS